jgi:NADPH-dependent curcumin reductase CurA
LNARDTAYRRFDLAIRRRTMSRAWHLVSRPEGMPTADNFDLREVALPKPEKGQIRVKNLWLSVDPYMRGRMNDVKSYIPPFALDAPLEGGAVGEVVESAAEGFAKGDRVLHMAGWRDEAVIDAKGLLKLPDADADPQLFLGILGVTGSTAYFGLLDAASAKEGDTVFVSAAAGAVGSAVVQIAKAKGMTVIGSAGGEDKCAFVRSLGADAVVDYRAGPVLKGLVRALKDVGKDGIDVYFDNVGGGHLDAALALANRDSRFAICGMIESYNKAEPTQLRFIMRIIAMRIRLKGFIVFDYQPRWQEFLADMIPWVKSGKVKSEETVVEGLDRTPEAFLGLFSGQNRGKMLVKL